MLRIVALLLLLLLLPGTVIAEPPLVLARAPQLSAGMTSDLWSPFVQYLSEATGRDVLLKVYEDRAQFEEDIRLGRVDLYFGNPGYGVIGHLLHDYQPLIRSDRKLLEGILVVRKDSDIHEVSDLQGKQVAFPDATAFAASLYLRHSIKAEFDIHYEPVYTGSHDNTYRAVLIGKTAAGGGVKRTLEQEDARLRDALRIIYKTPGIRSHPLMAHPRVPASVCDNIIRAVLGLARSEAGKKMLKDVKLQQPVRADYEHDYRPLEVLATRMYDYLLKADAR